MTGREKRLKHLEAVRLFTEREFHILEQFDLVVSAAGRYTVRLVITENDQGRVTKGSIAYRPVPVEVGGVTSSLVFMEDFTLKEVNLRDSLILPQAPEILVGSTREVRMGLESYPGMPDDIINGHVTAYRRPKLRLQADDVGAVRDRAMFPASISPNRLSAAQFEQVAFAQLLGFAATSLGVQTEL